MAEGGIDSNTLSEDAREYLFECLRGLEEEIKQIEEIKEAVERLKKTSKLSEKTSKLSEKELEIADEELRKEREIAIKKMMKYCEEEMKQHERRNSGLYTFDPNAVKLYNKALKEGQELDRTLRIMLIGCYKQGKTTLVRRLLGEPIDNVGSTEHIEVHNCVSKQLGSTVLWKRDEKLNTENIEKRIALISKSLQKHEIDRDESSGEFNAELSDTSSDDDDIAFSVDESMKEFRQALNDLSSTEENDSEKQLRIWDFGGQYIFYATHQIFHSQNAIYLLLFDLSIQLNQELPDEDFPGKATCKTMKDYIIFWMQSIHAFVGSSDGRKPVVILVGTHKDNLHNEDIAESYFTSVRELFQFSKLRFHIHPKQFALSLKDLDEEGTINELKLVILEAESKLEKIPAKWIVLENKLKSQSEDYVLSITELQNIDQKMKFPIGDREQIQLFLQYHHSKGNYLFFAVEEMAENVVTNPKFVIDAFSCIVKSKQFCSSDPDLFPLWKELIDEAILKPVLIQKVWQHKNEKFKAYQGLILFLLKKHRIIAEVLKYEAEDGSLKPEGFYIVPSLLKHSDNGAVEEFLLGKVSTLVSLVYSFDYSKIVETVFQRMLAAAIGTWATLRFKGILMVFDNWGLFELDLEHAGMIRLNQESIEIRIANLCPDKRNKVEIGIGDRLRRFVDVIINHEFRKLKMTSPEDQDRPSFDLNWRCCHKDHGYLGSLAVLSLKKMQEHQGDISRCPDNGNHSVSKKEVQTEWFDGRRDAAHIPTRKCTEKDCIAIAKAVGSDWQTLGLYLGVKPVKMQQIQSDHREAKLRTYYVLLDWLNTSQDGATLDVLIQALRKLSKDYVDWDTVNNLLDEFK